MMTKTNLFMPAFAALMVCALLITGFSPIAFAQSPKVITGSPGDTLSYSGTATPNSQVLLEVSASISVGTSVWGDGKNHYEQRLDGLNVPGGNSMTITVSPVDTLTISGAFSSAPLISDNIPCTVGNHVGSYSRSVPAARYNIDVTGIANGSPGSVRMSVQASQTQPVGSDGTYTASISTSGLPATVYTLKQNGDVVAMVYLGVTAPATPTPTPTPTPVPTPTPAPAAQQSQGPWTSAAGTNVTGNGTAATPMAYNETNSTTATILPSAVPTPTTGTGNDSGTMALIAIAFIVIIGVAAAYLFVIRKK